MKACKYCNTLIDPSEIYGDWFYCKTCGKEWTLCKADLHLQKKDSNLPPEKEYLD